MRRISLDRARRIAVGAQGFTAPRPAGRVDVRHFRRVMGDVGLLQLDSVNVIARSHYLPVLARLGTYDQDALDRYTARSGELFEYWAHAACLVPVEQHALFRWRMEGMRPWSRVQALEDEHPGYLATVLAEVAEQGPVAVSDLDDPGARTGSWWGYGKGKIALEWLFATGRIAAYRAGGFRRLYDLPDRVIPAVHLKAEAVELLDAYRELLVQAVRHHGVGTAGDLADYYRLHMPTARPLVHELAATGRLTEVAVDGWDEPAYMDPAAVSPRRIRGTALLSPFDSLIWNRERTERLFDFHYRIEIYVPKPKRQYGYYVLPVLHDGELVARVDLKAHRDTSRLEVRGAFGELRVGPESYLDGLAARLREMAEWEGLGVVEVADNGDLATKLSRRL
jgi:hypothetical protein